MKPLRWAFALATLLFGVATMLFFALAYPHHLHFQEQYQLFLYEWSYVSDVLSVPGGVADLVGRFFTQFFLYAWVGAGLIAALLVGVQLLTYVLLRSSRTEPLAYALSFVPSLLCCCFLCDDNALMSAPVALLLIVAVALLMRFITGNRWRRIIALLSIPLVYQLAGAFVLVYASLLIIQELRRERSFQTGVWTCVLLVVVLAVPAAWGQWMHYPLHRLYVGPHYYRQPDVFAQWAWAAAYVLPVLLLLPDRLRGWMPRLAVVTLSGIWAVLMLAGGMTVRSLHSQAQEDTMAYDFMARNAMWNRILQLAEHRAPRNQVSAVVVNLALAERGMLCDRMFEYRQKGLAGLLPNFDTDCVSPLATSEAFYRLGMINTAQRFVFEAQEAIPDYQKSARCYKRLAETNLINGAYEVARKYLVALQHTLFYRDWANATLALIADDSAVAAHPEYGELRAMRCQEDYFFGGNEVHQILAQQLQANPQNRLAFDYLEAACLLAKDLDLVTRYYPLSEPLGYTSMPSAIQQAMLLDWTQKHQPSDPIPTYFQPALLQHLNQFYSAMQLHNGNAATMRQLYGNTYWGYYYF